MYLFTSECVSPGHPDKTMDCIADKFVDSILLDDPNGRVAIEGIIAGNQICIGGEVTAKSRWTQPDLAAKLVRDVIKDIGYDADYPFEDHQAIHSNNVLVDIMINSQSADIAQGVDSAQGICAGDQGMVFGMATMETTSRMPSAIEYARNLCMALYEWVVHNPGRYGLDIKTQITLDYDTVSNFTYGYPARVHTIAVALPHLDSVPDTEPTEFVKGFLEAKGSEFFEGTPWEKAKLIVNGTGRYVTHSSIGDTGSVGRKIVVDAFGGRCPNGGGAFSGKDYSKVDRSGVYMARHIAKNVVENALAMTCQIQMGYVIGQPNPVSLNLYTAGTGQHPDSDILNKFVIPNFDLSVQGTIDLFKMDSPSEDNFMYYDLAKWGHFCPMWVDGLPWEKTKQIETIF